MLFFNSYLFISYEITYVNTNFCIFREFAPVAKVSDLKHRQRESTVHFSKIAKSFKTDFNEYKCVKFNTSYLINNFTYIKCIIIVLFNTFIHSHLIIFKNSFPHKGKHKWNCLVRSDNSLLFYFSTAESVQMLTR